MPDTPEIRSIVEAAERAAADGDYASAETRLREVARLQEASLGSSHPDLANTLNNLGVVCEITGKAEDAERCFRRAWTIATERLPPGHPFVATSRKNLEDFCAAHGKAIDSPPPSVTPPAPARTVAAEPSTPKAEADARRSEPVSKGAPPHAPPERRREAPPPVAARKRPFPLGIGALIAAGLLVTVVATATWLRSGDQAETSSQAEPPPQAEPAPQGGRSAAPAERPPTSAPPSAEPNVPETSKEPSEIAGGTVDEPPPAPPARRPSRPSQASAAQSLVVADARLCSGLSTAGREWACTPAGTSVGPGSLYFYTRIKSPADTTVEHRWYHGNGLIQSVELRIRANTGPGYRTYSRNTIGGERAGDWRVELRTGAGVLLHEERFVVR